MEGSEIEFENFTLPALKGFLEARSLCLATSNNLLRELQDALKSRSSGQPKNNAKTLLFFPTLHPLSTVIFATATVVAFVLLRNSRFNFHSYTQREATPTQKSDRKWRCDLLQLLARKITKGIHSCKPASLNSPIVRQCRACDTNVRWSATDTCCRQCLTEMPALGK